MQSLPQIRIRQRYMLVQPELHTRDSLLRRLQQVRQHGTVRTKNVLSKSQAMIPRYREWHIQRFIDV
jgi:hypothetical protein